MKYIKKFFVFVSLLLLTSCETREFEPGLQGLNVLFYPVAWVWWFIFIWFTPGYWAPLSRLWNDMSWIIALIPCLVAGIVYVVLLVIFMIIALIFTILVSVVWVLAAILNGIFHFTSWETRSVCATLIIPKLSFLMY